MIEKGEENTDKIAFGTGVNALIITDRLHALAKRLSQDLRENTDLETDVVFDIKGARKIIQEKPLDFLILAGYLKKQRNFKAVKEVLRLNPYANVVLWAHLDAAARRYRDSHEMENAFESFHSIPKFAEYMRRLSGE